MEPRQPNEERLIARVGEDDPVAFEELFERHREEVLSVCRRVLGPTEAEDATQETFLAAYLAIAKHGTRPHRLRGWLYSIAHNEAVSRLRGRQVNAPMPQDVADRDSAVYAIALQQSELRAIVDDLQQLPEDQRTALVLSGMEELSHREIAEGLKCRPEKVKALIFQARATLSGLRAAREIPCDRVRDLVTRARVGRPPAGLTRHLQACPSCAEFARKARQERRRAMLLRTAAGVRAGRTAPYREDRRTMFLPRTATSRDAGPERSTGGALRAIRARGKREDGTKESRGKEQP